MTYKRRRAAPDWDDDTAHQDDAKPARSDLGRAVAAWARAVKRAPLPDGAKVVAWCLSDYARMADSLEMYKTSGQASCWPSVARIAGECGMDARSARRLLHRLQAAGFLDIDGTSGGAGKTNLYILIEQDDDNPDSTVQDNPDSGVRVINQKPGQFQRRTRTAVADNPDSRGRKPGPSCPPNTIRTRHERVQDSDARRAAPGGRRRAARRDEDELDDRILMDNLADKGFYDPYAD